MKQCNLLLISLLFVISWIFTNCKKDEKGPSLDFYGDEFIDQNTTVDTSSTMKFKFIARSETELGYIKISIENVDTTEWEAEIPSLCCKYEYTGSASVKAPKAVGVYNYVFSLYNADPDSVSNAALLLTKKIEITVDTATYLRQEFTAKLYHVQATIGNGAWDLVANVRKDSADAVADKDMVQISKDTTGSAWVAGWKGGMGNVTRFVKAATAFSYDKATVRSAKSAFDAGFPVAFVSPVLVNSIYIAKLRGLDEYAVIKITKITPADVTGTTDLSKGSLEFTYKKKP